MPPATSPSNFLVSLVEADLAAGRHTAIRTRFPPEPNGYLHIGHAKAICLNFGLSHQFPGRTHLRFDDTNPEKEEQEYVDSIQADIRWLGFDWGEYLYFASDFFGRMFEVGEKLIREGHAYVCAQTEDEMRAGRGTVETAGTPSPWRERPAPESLDLFRRMRAGEFPDGAYTLRAKIDMSAANMKLRDPPLYRIRHAHHQHVGDAWCIYPMYDYAHPLCDAFEGITHSICTLEFENNRDVYDWVVEHSGIRPAPHQYEFARLALTYTVLSKRKLVTLVNGGHVSGWDDPRMPTLAGLRRRGVTASAIREFCDRIGVSKANSIVDVGLLEHSIREELNVTAPRYLAVLNPLAVEISNLDADETILAPHHPETDTRTDTRELRLTRRIFIDADDFREEPPPGWHRLAPGRVVRLRFAGFIRCDEVLKDPAGKVVGLRVSRLAEPGKVAGTLHWVSATTSVPLEVRLYDRLFKVERPGTGDADFLTELNPDSGRVLEARGEPSLREVAPGAPVQLERVGYFVADTVDSRPGAPVFNRVVPLKDTYSGAGYGRPDGSGSGAGYGRPDGSVSGAGYDRPDGRGHGAGYGAPALSPAEQALVDSGVSVTGARVFAADAGAHAVYREAVAAGGKAAAVENWLVASTAREVRAAGLKPTGAQLAALTEAVASGSLSSRQAKEVWADMLVSGQDVAAVVARLGLGAVLETGAVEGLVREVVAANPAQAEAYRAGKTALAGYFVGAVLKRTRGAADPGEVQELVRRVLEGG